MHNCSKKHLIFVSVSYMIHLLYEVCTNLLFCCWGGSIYLSVWRVTFFRTLNGGGPQRLGQTFSQFSGPPPPPVNNSQFFQVAHQKIFGVVPYFLLSL